MYLPDFDYYTPETLEGTCALLRKFGDDARLLAGGTDLLTKMKNGMVSPKVLISLRKIGKMDRIEHVPGRGVVIGARATHNDVMNSPVLQARYPAVCEAAHSMANNQIRNLGTVGGNLVNAVPSADLPPILIALHSHVTLVGMEGVRMLQMEQFFVGPNRSAILRDEVLTQITIPDQPTTGSAYLKFGLRRSGALAVVGVAASVQADGLYVANGRIVLGAVSPTPIRARTAEQALTGRIVTEDLLEEVGRAAARECRPISDMRASEEYRRDMVRVFTKRALRKALHMDVGQTKEGGNGNGAY